MSNLYLTADQIGTPTGGGAVTYNELMALKELGETIVLSAEQLNPMKYGLPDTPFLSDFLARERIKNIIPGVAHFYSGTFTQTIEWLKYTANSFITYTCPAHDRHESMEEFKRMGLPYNYPHIANDELWQMFTGGLKEADMVIAPSKLSADFLDKEGCKRLTIIPHGCNIPERVPKLPDAFKIGYLGQLGPDKGIPYLLTAWTKLDYRDSVAIMAGSDINTTQYLIHRYADGGRFHCMGHVPDIADFFSDISVYVQPSMCESFGITALEAMAYGRPVICSDGAGASELITEGVDGFVVKKRDPGAIAERIDWCFRNRYKLSEMGEKARLKAEEYSWEKIKQRYVELWRKTFQS